MITTSMLTSCADDPQMQAASAARNLPANYKSMALAYVKAHLKDPASCTYLQMDNYPPRSNGSGTAVLVLANAKNSFGGYTGIKPILVMFKDGQIVDSVE